MIARHKAKWSPRVKDVISLGVREFIGSSVGTSREVQELAGSPSEVRREIVGSSPEDRRKLTGRAIDVPEL